RFALAIAPLLPVVPVITALAAFSLALGGTFGAERTFRAFPLGPLVLARPTRPPAVARLVEAVQRRLQDWVHVRLQAVDDPVQLGGDRVPLGRAGVGRPVELDAAQVGRDPVGE